MQLLQDQDTFVRVNAARALGQIGTPNAIMAVVDVVPSMIQELQHQDKWVVRNAVKALGFVGEGAVDAVPDLKRLLEDENTFVRANAAWALKQIVTPDAIKDEEKVL
jgi:HEAT repeat protein